MASTVVVVVLVWTLLSVALALTAGRALRRADVLGRSRRTTWASRPWRARSREQVTAGR